MNIDIPNNISKICNLLNIYLIHLSTDYVYDGQNPPFTPNTEPNPLQNYGISKLIAEKRIMSNMKNNYLILRVPVLYSLNFKSLEESAVTLILKKIMNRVEDFKEDNYSIRRPLLIENLSKFILNCVFSRLKGIHLFYNKYDKFTKYQILKLSSKLFEKSINHITPINDKPFYDTALRPKDTNLVDSEIENNYNNFTIISLTNGLKNIINKFKHPKVYHNT